MGQDNELIVGAYDEIALKGRKRRWFVGLLLDNIAAICNIPRDSVREEWGRVYVSVPPGRNVEDVCGSLQRVFGLTWFAVATACNLEIDAFRAEAVTQAKARFAEGARTFAIQTMRPNKKFPLNSKHVEIDVGDAVLKETPEYTVNLSAPQATIYIELRHTQSLVYSKRRRGPGGLPVGSTGKALLLLSGGIDSPVAGWYLQKRGLKVDLLYFHSPPYTGAQAREKVIDLARQLSTWSGRTMKLYVARFTEIQERVAEHVGRTNWTVSHRRFMHLVAHHIVAQNGYNAIATGDCIGQVASQTLANMNAIDAATPDLVLRPLIGMDKSQIIRRAREIGTYDISVRPFEDCCVLFAPRHPTTYGRVHVIEKQESTLDRDALIADALAHTEELHFTGTEDSP